MKTRFKVGLGLALALILTVGIFSSAGATISLTKTICEGDGGVWDGVDSNNGTCTWDAPHAKVTTYCPGYDFTYNFASGGGASQLNYKCGNYPAEPMNYGMERKGYCKLVSLADEGFLGGTISAVVKGTPIHLKLKADGKTYTLPVVPGSVVANGDGTYTAQFYTIDPVTGQALVPAGEYTARCHGSNGSKDGGSSNTITIGY